MEAVATTTQVAAPSRTTSPIALWHLLSLDAPSVAALWTWFVARCYGIRLPLASALAMALAVWILYAADRLLDTRHLLSNTPHGSADELEARHLFHFRHRGAFLCGIAIAGLLLTALLPKLLNATLHLYLFEGTLLVGWFLLVHATRLRLPKELVVGVYFALATFTPTAVRNPAQVTGLIIGAVLFAALCTLNCLLIHSWERTRDCSAALLKTATAALMTISVATVLTTNAPSGPIAIACGLAAVLLLILHNTRAHLSRIHVRAAADLALLAPLLVVPFVR